VKAYLLRPAFRGLVAMACVVGLLADHAFGSDAITVTRDPQSPTGGIQEAIDALGSSGGIVTIPAGEYLIRQSIRLRSGVKLQGAGETTILRKNKQFGSQLIAVTEGKKALVEDATGFRPGDEVGFFDRTSVGWLHGHARVIAVEGQALLLDKGPGGKFDPANGGAVINYFPAISGRDVSDVAIQHLSVDGETSGNPGPLSVSQRAPRAPPELGFTFAAIDLVRVADSRVEDVHVRGWPADGISVQGKVAEQGKYRGNVVTKCRVENCRGPGFHAGGRLEDSEFFENEARNNLGDGFYFCAWVTRISVRNNKFIANHASGIGGLGDSDDKENVVEHNLCDRNGTNGISLSDGQRSTVRNNTCSNNSQREPGRFSGIALGKTRHSVVAGNVCFDDQSAKTQKHGITETADSHSNRFADNQCRGNLQSDMQLRGKAAPR